ncbi:MAG: 16S rRNA (adenine(1518)-N(6)/adenine(1519)-N(6))-dimethyltransferase RsmA [Patescibacteria group bacterium]|nr:16S rRNA (adenine(1518)-N(6)/adenine(1519)-N(6))-dimethyltransferase RsmA [Patescibacteria group bacterium]
MDIDLTDIKTIKSLLTHYNTSAHKSLGQNFLIDPEVLDEILCAAQLSKNDFVVEVGPGFGVLTLPVADAAGRVLAIETDKKILQILKALSSGYTNIDILPANVLKLESRQLYERYRLWRKARNKTTQYKLVSNLPYYITSSILKQFLETEFRPSLLVVMVQKEVAERIVAKEGERSILSVSVQFFGKPEIVRIVPKTSFWPKPEVDSAILKIVPYPELPHNVDDIKLFFRVVKAGFGERRKQLHNALSGGLGVDDTVMQKVLKENRINPKHRAQDLSIDQWVKLYHALEKII